MGVCRICWREMTTACGCKKIPITHHGKKYDPIKMGEKGDFFEDMGDGRCGDCGALPGHYHHSGCDCERCPICGGQIMSCGCDDAANSYAYMAERAEEHSQTLAETIQLAAKNLLTINYIDTRKKYEKELWYRFIRVPVDGGFAIYQVTHVTKAYVNLTACFLAGVPEPQRINPHIDFKYDRVDPGWWRTARVARGRVEKLLKKQDEECLDWLQIRKEILEGR